MLWVPRVDEVPMSLARIDPDGTCGVMVERVGEATKALHNLEQGQTLGIRGPFGNHFRLVKGRVLLVSGGMGIAPLIPLGKSLSNLGATVEFACGAKTAANFCGLELVGKIIEGNALSLATDDGSLGDRGFVTSILPSLFETREFDMVYCCGPEPMTKAVFSLTEKYGIPLQASMERIIKCSVGLCGNCMIGKYRVCKDGLILASEQLREVAEEFGVYRRGFDGRKIPF